MTIQTSPDTMTPDEAATLGTWARTRLAEEAARLGLPDALLPVTPDHLDGIGRCVAKFLAGDGAGGVALFNAWAETAARPQLALVSASPVAIRMGTLTVEFSADDLRIIQAPAPTFPATDLNAIAQQIGQQFHARLEAEFQRLGIPDATHPEDAEHDIVVGHVVAMIFDGQVDEAVGHYNRWASGHGYEQLAVLSRDPLRIHIGNAVVEVTERSFRVVSAASPRRLPPVDSSIVVVVNRGEFYIGLEKVEGHLFAHCDVFVPWTRGVRDRLRADVDALVAMQGGPLHISTGAPHGGDYAKWARFCRSLGFEFNTMIPCRDGGELPVFSRSV